MSDRTPSPTPEAGQDERARVTERDMLDLLRERYTVDVGNGPRFAFAEHVKNFAGFETTRIADFIAIDCWPAKGLHLHGHEVKVSRSDWLTELRDPSKAEAFKRYMDRWWLVAADEQIVRHGELPEGWGLMVPARNGRLRVVRSAPVLTPEPLPRSMLACLLRATAKSAARAVAS